VGAAPERQPIRLARRLGLRPGPPGARSWLDLLFVAWLGWLYDVINNVAAVRQGLAESNARALLHAERALHLAPERSLNRWLAARHTLSQVTVFWYENVHGVVLIAMFVLLWWLRPDLLRRLRGVLAVVSVVALIVFWSYPVAPPRMLVGDGYVDLVAAVHHLPVWHAGAVSTDSNQLAAFPSLHLAWGVWASLTLWAMTRRRWLRALAVAYPVVTLFAVMATGNHFLLDALAGALLTVLVAALASRLAARRQDQPAVGQPAVARRSAA
jgi:hypothetical protein